MSCCLRENSACACIILHRVVYWQVKAERHVDEETTIEDLQHKTIKHIKEEHHSEEETLPDPSKAGKGS